MVTFTEETTESLVARVRRGDPAAEAALYLRFFDPVYRYAHVMSGDAAEAEAITNDVFTRAVALLRNVRFIRVRRVRAWLLRLTRDVASAYTASDVRPAAGDELATLVHGLPGDERHVVALRYGIGCDDEEIATVLRASVERARQLQARALGTLRERLAPSPATA